MNKLTKITTSILFTLCTSSLMASQTQGNVLDNDKRDFSPNNACENIKERYYDHLLEDSDRDLVSDRDKIYSDCNLIANAEDVSSKYSSYIFLTKMSF